MAKKKISDDMASSADIELAQGSTPKKRSRRKAEETTVISNTPEVIEKEDDNGGSYDSEAVLSTSPDGIDTARQSDTSERSESAPADEKSLSLGGIKKKKRSKPRTSDGNLFASVPDANEIEKLTPIFDTTVSDTDLIEEEAISALPHAEPDPALLAYDTDEIEDTRESAEEHARYEAFLAEYKLAMADVLKAKSEQVHLGSHELEIDDLVITDDEDELIYDDDEPVTDDEWESISRAMSGDKNSLELFDTQDITDGIEGGEADFAVDENNVSPAKMAIDVEAVTVSDADSKMDTADVTDSTEEAADDSDSDVDDTSYGAEEAGADKSNGESNGEKSADSVQSDSESAESLMTVDDPIGEDEAERVETDEAAKDGENEESAAIIEAADAENAESMTADEATDANNRAKSELEDEALIGEDNSESTEANEDTERSDNTDAKEASDLSSLSQSHDREIEPVDLLTTADIWNSHSTEDTADDNIEPEKSEEIESEEDDEYYGEDDVIEGAAQLQMDLGDEISSDYGEKKKGYDPEKPRLIDTVFETVELIAFTFIAVMIITCFFFRHSVVDGGSMDKTLSDGDILIISDFLYEPKRGDIVVFEDHKVSGETALIKRIIGIEGDTVRIEKNGTVYLNGEPLIEKYTHNSFKHEYNEGEWVVGEGEVFVLGDHRNNSRDSEDFGPVSADSIIGRVLFRFYPFDSFGAVD
ncbi:MAG: signal peptidase I [Clostridia bacterium]|nr:signal peptidase I [Clostridia bacterium]